MNQKQLNSFGLICRNIPAFKGKLRVINLFINKTRFKFKDLEVTTKKGIKLILPNIIEFGYFELFVNGTYEEENIDFMMTYINDQKCFIDIGANIGLMSVLIAKTNPNSTVLAVEASPQMFTYLQKNIALNNIKNIIAKHIAVYDKDGEELPFYTPKDKTGSGSFTPLFTTEFNLVKTITLDTLLVEEKIAFDSIGIIKIDIEGYELLAFKGATKLNASGKARYFFEFMDWAEENAGYVPGEAQTYLLDNGFTLYSYEHLKLQELKTAQKKDYNMIMAIKEGN